MNFGGCQGGAFRPGLSWTLKDFRMLLPLSLGVLHAFEPDHVAVVTGVSLQGKRRGAWKVGLAFGLSHMLAVGLLAGLSALLGRTLFGDRACDWLDRAAWAFVILLGLWNLAAACGLRALRIHTHTHTHGALEHVHPHEERWGHRFHHSAAWLGAFFGLGGVRGFLTLSHQAQSWAFIWALLLFGLGITATFMALSWVSGWLAARLGTTARWQRGLYFASGCGNVAVGLWLLLK